MERIAPAVLTVLLLLGAAGCASSGNSAGPRDPNRITPAEIESSDVTGSAYGLVEKLRPLWLRRRGRHSLVGESSIWVYVDGTRVGAPESLDQISAMDVASLEFLDAAKATNRYGAGHDHGVISVRRKRR